MPTIELNKEHWGTNYAWPKDGDEWSERWGNPRAQWFGSILPRINSFVPARNILEIAPGFGRWTEYLKDICENLTVVDLNENCIERCRQRFSMSSNIEYHVNDGSSLEMIPDNSVDFIFSFDSLVHAELSVLQAYLMQFAAKLEHNGVAFLHHSNIGTYDFRWRLSGRLPKRIKGILTDIGILNYYHFRSFSVTAKKFEEAAKNAGLRCISQELINWGQRLLIDAFSVVVREDSDWPRTNRAYRNYDFMHEADLTSNLAKLYSSYGQAATDSTSSHRLQWGDRVANNRTSPKSGV